MIMAIIKHASSYKNNHFVKKNDSIDVQRLVAKDKEKKWLTQPVECGQLPMAIPTV